MTTGAAFLANAPIQQESTDDIVIAASLDSVKKVRMRTVKLTVST